MQDLELSGDSEFVFGVKMRREGNKIYFDILKKQLTPLEENCLKDFIRRQVIEEEGLRQLEGDFY